MSYHINQRVCFCQRTDTQISDYLPHFVNWSGPMLARQLQHHRLASLMLTLAIALVAANPAVSSVLQAGLEGRAISVPKQVALIVEPDRLLASNTRLGRIDAQSLEPDEQLVSQAEASAALVIATNLRILTYGPVIGWRILALAEGEQVESLRAEDFAVFIVTDQRYINFNAASGVWGEEPR